MADRPKITSHVSFLLDLAGAWLFGYIPTEIREDIETKHPDLHLIGFRRGVSIQDLRREDPRDRFVAIPELWGWGVLRDGPPKRREPTRRLARGDA